MAIISTETKGLKEKYGDERRTQIIAQGIGEFSAEDLIPNEPTIVLITADGYIKRLPPDTFRTQERGGKGVAGVKTKEEDQVDQVFSSTTHSDLMFFTSRGRVFALKAYDVPPGSRTSKGQALQNFLQLAPGEKVTSVLSGEEMTDVKFLMFMTANGNIKKTPLEDFANVRKNGLNAMKLTGDDVLIYVRPTTGKDAVSIVTADGQSIRFGEKDVRPMGRGAAGVRGIRLKGKDKVVGMDIVPADDATKSGLELLVVTDHGYGKRTSLEQYKTQGRGGSGIRTAHVTEKTGKIVMAMVINAKEDRDLLAISDQGQVIRVPLGSISQLGRDTQGVRIMKFKEEKDGIASVTLV
jgi:DNA gyrase subunit A